MNWDEWKSLTFNNKKKQTNKERGSKHAFRTRLVNPLFLKITIQIIMNFMIIPFMGRCEKNQAHVNKIT